MRALQRRSIEAAVLTPAVTFVVLSVRWEATLVVVREHGARKEKRYGSQYLLKINLLAREAAGKTTPLTQQENKTLQEK